MTAGQNEGIFNLAYPRIVNCSLITGYFYMFADEILVDSGLSE